MQGCAKVDRLMGARQWTPEFCRNYSRVSVEFLSNFFRISHEFPASFRRVPRRPARACTPATLMHSSESLRFSPLPPPQQRPSLWQTCEPCAL